MAETSAIAWTHATFNPWIGCAKVSEACRYCYAERDRATAAAEQRTGLKLWGPDASRSETSKAYWRQPLKWNREAGAAGERRRVFCASLADVFEDRRDLDILRHRLYDLIDSTESLDWLLLTKRPEKISKLAPSRWLPGIATGQGGEWPRHVWAGTTIEGPGNLARAFDLIKIPASVRFLSLEPLLENVDLTPVLSCPTCKPGSRGWDGPWLGPAHKREVCPTCKGYPEVSPIHWVILGGESGPHARPMDVAWVRSIMAQCRARGVKVFVKQLGCFPHSAGEGAGWAEFLTGETRKHWRWDDKSTGTLNVFQQFDRKGGDWDEWPEDLRVREFPA